MEFGNVFDLIDMFSEKDIDSFEVKDGIFRLQLKKDPSGKIIDNKQVISKIEAETDTRVRATEQDLDLDEEMTIEERSEALQSTIKDLLEEVKSKYLGFYHVVTPTAQESEGHGEPLGVGSYVKKGQTLCFVSVLGENKEMTSPIDGIIRQANFAEGAFVQYGATLFIIEKVGE